MATGKQWMALLASSSSIVSLAAGQNLATLTPFPGAEPVTVTAQYQVVPSCQLETITGQSTVTGAFTTSVTQVVQTIPLCTPSTFVSTAVPTYSNYVRGSTLVNNIAQAVTFNSADFTISASASASPIPTASANSTRNATVTGVAGRSKRQLAGTVIDIKSIQDYDRIGALAIPNYDGSGLCTECGPDSAGALTQAFTVVSCSSTIGASGNCTTFNQTLIASPTKYTPAGATAPISTTTTNTYGPGATPTEAMPGAGNPGSAAPTGSGSSGSGSSSNPNTAGSNLPGGYGTYGSYGSYGNVAAAAAPGSGSGSGSSSGSGSGSPAPGSPYYAPQGSSPAFYPGPAGNPQPIAYPPGQNKPVPYPWSQGGRPYQPGQPSVVTTTVFETTTTTQTVPASTFTTTSMSTPANGGAPVTATTTVTAPASTITAPVTLTTTTTVTATPTNAAGNPLLCPQFDGQIIGSSTGATYLVECGRAIVGTQITNVAKRQSNPTAPTVDVCINLCCQIDNCVAINLTPNGCDYFSSFTGTVVAVNVTALFQEACPASDRTSTSSTASSTTSSSSTSTSNGSFMTTSTSTSSGTVISGTVATTSSLVPVPTNSLCPVFNGQEFTDPNGNVYTVNCDSAFTGTRIDTGLRRRQTAISVSVCLDVCCGLTECVAVNYTPAGTCEYFSFIDGVISVTGGIAAQKDTCNSKPTTTLSGMSTTSTSTSSSGVSSPISSPSGSFATTSTSSSGGSFATTSTSSTGGSFITTSTSTSGSFLTTITSTGTTSSSATTITGTIPTSSVCPAQNRQDVTDSSDNTFNVGCDQSFTGTVIPTSLRRRQAVSFAACSNTCCALTGCVGFNLLSTGCQYFSAITGTVVSQGSIAAREISCAGSSTSSSSSSVFTTTSVSTSGSFLTTITSTGTSTSSSATTTSSTSTSSGGGDALPTLTIPGGPTVTLPTISVPTDDPVTLPTVTLPETTLTLPTLDPTAPVTLPTISIPGVTTLTLPTIGTGLTSDLPTGLTSDLPTSIPVPTGGITLTAPDGGPTVTIGTSELPTGIPTEGTTITEPEITATIPPVGETGVTSDLPVTTNIPVTTDLPVSLPNGGTTDVPVTTSIPLTTAVSDPVTVPTSDLPIGGDPTTGVTTVITTPIPTTFATVVTPTTLPNGETSLTTALSTGNVVGTLTSVIGSVVTPVVTGLGL